MVFNEPLDLFIDATEPRASRLINLPNKIWVFGGPIEENSKPPASLRDSFWRQTLSPSVQYEWLEGFDRPENHEDWWAFSGYEDLLEFERDACYLARATLLFAESPGSLAELGALSLDDSILSKLFVIVESKYRNENTRRSFLNLGPLNRVDKHGFKCDIGTCSNPSQKLSDDDFETITNSINTWLPALAQTAILCTKNPTHRLLLLADIIDLLLVCKKSDIQKAGAHFGLKMDDNELDKSLQLLDFFRFIKIERRGHEFFFVHRKSSGAPWIDYKAKIKDSFDRSRFKIARLAWIEKDSRRLSIYRGQS